MLVLLVAAVTGAWADIIPTYDLKVGTNAQGTVKFYVAETERHRNGSDRAQHGLERRRTAGTVVRRH